MVTKDNLGDVSKTSEPEVVRLPLREDSANKAGSSKVLGKSTLDYIMFKHKGETSGAFINVTYRSMSFEFQDNFFRSGEFTAFSEKEAEEISRRQGFTQYRTHAILIDKNGFISHFRYNNKNELDDAVTRTTQSVETNPGRAFAFWVSLAKALRDNPETPEPFKKNLEEIAHITTLDAYIERLVKERKQNPAEIFNHDYLRRIRPDVSAEYLSTK